MTRVRGELPSGGGGWERVSIDDAANRPMDGSDVDLLALDEALTTLARVDPRAARVVELKFFGGLREEDVAVILSVSASTVRDDWKMAKAWLRDALRENTHDRP